MERLLGLLLGLGEKTDQSVAVASLVTLPETMPGRTSAPVFFLFSKWGIDLVTVFDAILKSRREKLQCLCENLMSNNFRKTAVLKKISIVN